MILRAADRTIQPCTDNRGGAMKRTSLQHTVVILAVTILLAGCATNYAQRAVPIEDATTVLQEGDLVGLTLSNDNVAYMTVKEIDETEIYGSRTEPLFGRDETIDMRHIKEIYVYKEDGYDYEATTEMWSWIWAFAFWGLVL